MHINATANLRTPGAEEHEELRPPPEAPGAALSLDAAVVSALPVPPTPQHKAEFRPLGGAMCDNTLQNSELMMTRRTEYLAYLKRIGVGPWVSAQVRFTSA